MSSDCNDLPAECRTRTREPVLSDPHQLGKCMIGRFEEHGLKVGGDGRAGGLYRLVAMAPCRRRAAQVTFAVVSSAQHDPDAAG
jgi:hypothetical protein